MATDKARKSVKQLATKGDVKSARILAREVVRSNRQKDRLSVSKARLGSINNQLQQQLCPCNYLFVLRSETDLSASYSYGESHRGSAEIDGDNEALQSARATTTDQPRHEGLEHGDDQGQPRLTNVAVAHIEIPD